MTDQMGILRPSRKDRRWLWLDVPLMAYAEAWPLQVRLVEARKLSSSLTDVFLLLEHPAVFTLGRRGGKEHLKVTEGFLSQAGIPLFQVERGGNITFHGRGQLVGYGIIDLSALGFSVVDYVTKLEEVMIRTAAQWGVHAERNPINRGIWAGGKKLGSIGLAVRRGISFHGFAFNVNVSLEPFRWINPCGLEGVEVTSMADLLGQEIPVVEVRKAIRDQLAAVFEVELTQTTLREIETRLVEAARAASP